MTALAAAGAGVAALFGLATSLRPKTPLFYQIIVYGACTYFLGLLYGFLFHTLHPGMEGFHIGYLGYAGMFFFLFSSYLGALDRLADGHEPQFRPYRLAAFIPVGLILAAGIWQYVHGRPLFHLLLLLPVAGCAYYACKHLTLPDVEMGIIRVMRPYNGAILLLCLLQPFAIPASMLGTGSLLISAANALLILLLLPLAYKGVRKWFI